MTTPESPTAPEPMMPAVAMGLTQQVEELVDKLDVMEERRLMDRRLWLVGIAVTVGLSVLSLVMVGGLVYLGSVNRSNGDAVRDCTTPGGECYERNQAQTGKAVALILQQELAIVKCARRTDTDQQLEACVEMEMRAYIEQTEAAD